MRYRRMSYRYTLLLGGQPGPLGSGVALGDERLRRVGVIVAQPHWCPASDVYETADALYVTVELAGVDPDELEIALYEDVLVVEGQRRLPCAPGVRGVYHAAAIRQGPFRAEVPLPFRVDPERVDARYDGGLLSVTLGRPEGAGR